MTAPAGYTPVAMKTLSLWQPWASLIALGHKTIETRSWPTGYRGPLAIHATQHCEAGPIGEFDVEDDTPRRSDKQYLLRGPISHPYRLPLGALVATCLLVDVVPMLAVDDCTGSDAHVTFSRHNPDGLGLYHPSVGYHSAGRSVAEHFEWQLTDISGQRPYGDFRPGRFAWVLSDIVPINPPIPARGRQQLWTWTPPDERPVPVESAVRS